mgnify:CR=1 FL=1
MAAIEQLELCSAVSHRVCTCLTTCGWRRSALRFIRAVSLSKLSHFAWKSSSSLSSDDESSSSSPSASAMASAALALAAAGAPPGFLAISPVIEARSALAFCSIVSSRTFSDLREIDAPRPRPSRSLPIASISRELRPTRAIFSRAEIHSCCASKSARTLRATPDAARASTDVVRIRTRLFRRAARAGEWQVGRRQSRLSTRTGSIC